MRHPMTEKKKARFDEPFLEVTYFFTSDVILTSEIELDPDEWPEEQ